MKKVAYKTNMKILMVSGTKHNMLWAFSYIFKDYLSTFSAWMLKIYEERKCAYDPLQIMLFRRAKTQTDVWLQLYFNVRSKTSSVKGTCRSLITQELYLQSKLKIKKPNYFTCFTEVISGSYWSCQSLVHMWQSWDSKSQKAALAVTNSGPGALE